MQNFRNAGFIKSYPALLHLPITVSEKSLIELVLSFTDKGNLDLIKRAGFKDIQTIMQSLCFKGYLCIK